MRICTVHTPSFDCKLIFDHPSTSILHKRPKRKQKDARVPQTVPQTVQSHTKQTMSWQKLKNFWKFKKMIFVLTLFCSIIVLDAIPSREGIYLISHEEEK